MDVTRWISREVGGLQLAIRFAVRSMAAADPRLISMDGVSAHPCARQCTIGCAQLQEYVWPTSMFFHEKGALLPRIQKLRLP